MLYGHLELGKLIEFTGGVRLDEVFSSRTFGQGDLWRGPSLQMALRISSWNASRTGIVICRMVQKKRLIRRLYNS